MPFDLNKNYRLVGGENVTPYFYQNGRYYTLTGKELPGDPNAKSEDRPTFEITAAVPEKPVKASDFVCPDCGKVFDQDRKLRLHRLHFKHDRG
jgi:predicted RNA-binding Zn-ribbon protein involved in translation (DUF1610 family)